MRTYGRVPAVPGGKPTIWVEVSTDVNGLNDDVWITTMIQTIKLNLNESPFFGNYGIPARQAVAAQVFPDIYLFQIQQQFSVYFSNLVISKEPSATPTYRAGITTNQGRKRSVTVPT